VTVKVPPPDVAELARRIVALEGEHDALKRDLGHLSLRLTRWLRVIGRRSGGRRYERAPP
jgi:hypothetical protein